MSPWTVPPSRPSHSHRSRTDNSRSPTGPGPDRRKRTAPGRARQPVSYSVHCHAPSRAIVTTCDSEEAPFRRAPVTPCLLPRSIRRLLGLVPLQSYDRAMHISASRGREARLAGTSPECGAMGAGSRQSDRGRRAEPGRSRRTRSAAGAVRGLPGDSAGLRDFATARPSGAEQPPARTVSATSR